MFTRQNDRREFSKFGNQFLKVFTNFQASDVDRISIDFLNREVRHVKCTTDSE